MHPLFFIGAALMVVGLIASGDKKKPADNTQTGDVAPDKPEAAPIECEAEVINEDDPSNNGQQALIDKAMAHLSKDMPAQFKGISIKEDLRQLQAEYPHEIPEQASVIFRKVSHMFRQKGNHEKAELWKQLADYVRDYPDKGGNDGMD